MSIFSNLISEFQIIDYVPTHNQLLIRSLRNNNRGYNIDIIFKGVSFFLLPTINNGIEISLMEASQYKACLVNDYALKETRDYQIFNLKNAGGKDFFINAMCFGVYHNNLDILKTSIGRYDFEDFGELVLWYAG